MPDEKRDKRAAFLRLGKHRMTKMMKTYGHIANLANTNAYEYTEKEAQAIVEALERGVDRVRGAFRLGAEEDPNKFEFPDE